MRLFPKHEKKEWYTTEEVFGRIRYRQWWYQNTIGGRVAFFFLRFKFIPKYFSEMWFRIRMAAQKIVRGFSDDEIWDLRSSVVAFVYPRIVMFRDSYSAICPGVISDEMFPGVLNMSEEQEKLANARWKEILDTMVYAFEQMYEGNEYKLREEENAKIEDGLYLFAKYFYCLWD